MGQKDNGLLFADSLFEDLERAIPERHSGGDGNGLPVEVVLEHRRLAAWRPGTTPVRALAQSAFVDEDDRAPFFSGFFLISGHVFRFQWPMASSSRSSARPVGRCGLQFSCRNSFQTCPAWY